MTSTSAPPLSRDTLLAWPKAELHCHLDGSLRLSTLLELARQQDKLDLLPATTLSGLEAALRGVDEADSLEAYLAWFQYTIPLMQSREALYRIAYELAEDAAAENVAYLEVRYAPVLHRAEGLTLEAINEAVLAGLAAASAATGLRTTLIVCGLRDRFESASLRQAELAADYRDRGVVAFDLAGAEAGNPPKHHLSAFQYAREHLLGLTIHAGESWGPDSIRQALAACGAHRIGHGITLVQDEELLRYVVDHRIPLEICPTSNVQTKVVSSFEDHPVRTLAEAGVAVTINTDNRLFSRTSVTEELWRTHTRCGVPAQTIREIVLNGFRHAFLPWAEKQALLARVEPQLTF
ncbi:MAG: adenosine deaminase [Bacteroidota bacterium]